MNGDQQQRERNHLYDSNKSLDEDLLRRMRWRVEGSDNICSLIEMLRHHTSFHTLTRRSKNKQTYKQTPVFEIRLLLTVHCNEVDTGLCFSTSLGLLGANVNASDEGRSLSACKCEWKNKCTVLRVLKIPPWHLTCFPCGLNEEYVWERDRKRQKKVLVLRLDFQV